MQQSDLDEITEDLRRLLAERLNVRARSFGRAVRKAGRLLPAPARQAARDLATLEARLRHPKLAARTDPAMARAAAETIRQALARHPPGARAARDRAFLLADLGVKALLLIGLALAIVYWRGGGA
jgi:hypothetical protein